MWWRGLPGNCDLSENADYPYGKRRLRQIDGRIRFLRKRIEAAEVVDPETPRTGQAATRAFFGATVRYANAVGVERVVSIVGTDEVDLDRDVRAARQRRPLTEGPVSNRDATTATDLRGSPPSRSARSIAFAMANVSALP